MSDYDILPSAQLTQRSSQQAVSSTSVQAWDMPGPSRGPGSSRGPAPSWGRGPSQGPGTSQSQPSQEELTQIQDKLMLLMDRVGQLTGNSKSTKRPAEQKPFDKRPKEQCQICKRLFANKTTLFRHYRDFHPQENPEKYHGCSVNNTVVNLDMSVREITCAICEYVATDQNALDAHNRAVHSNVVNVNSDDANIRTANGVASVNSNNNGVNGTGVVVPGVANRENVNNNVINVMHKCAECGGYFERRNELDEHMKVQHGFEVVCKICNKNLLFKDYDAHVKDSHPDVYKKNEKVIVEKVMRNKKGDRVHVFICTKCDIKMVGKIEADKHARGHKKGLKIKVAPRNKVSKAKENLTHVTPNNDHIILTCDSCDICTDSYDAAVEHSQNHIYTSNSNDIVTQQCRICKLKFEPFCFTKHLDLHYKNKEIHKESFKYYKYRFQTLLSENWFDCFNMSKHAFEEMLSGSIYEHTRSVKMRVPIQQFGLYFNKTAYKLYKCCQCENFVEPAAVLNHTMNYDTCLKVQSSYACDVCKKKFNNRFARDNHTKDHKSEDNYKIVLFNHEHDKDFNKRLNDPNITHEVNNDADANAPKVLYKCLCGVCFVRRENADKHKRICPAKEPKKSCPKCNNMFHLEELLTHCFEHHFNETRIVIENISPDVIVIDSDDDGDGVIEIYSSDEDDAQTERFSNIKIEILRGDDATAVRGSSEGARQAERQNTNASETAMTKASENIQVASGETLLIEKSEKDDIDENENQCDEDFGGVDIVMTDEEDSQDTISYGNTETDTDAANPANLKCVPMNLLLNPLRIENCFLNEEVTAGIATVRQQIETTNASVRFETEIKQEKSWFDPTDFSNIRSRRSLRQIEVQPASDNLSQEIIELMLTDDEEAEMNNFGDATEMNDYIRSDENNDNFDEETENNNMREDPSSNISNTPMTQNVDAVVEVFNDLSHTTNNENITPITHNEINTIERSAGENNVNCEDDHTELTESNDQRVDINEAIHSFQGEAEYNENNDQDYSYNDDDLFVPSGIPSREQPQNTELNVNEKEMPNNPRHAAQVIAQVTSANNTTHSCENIENIPVDNTRIRVENPVENPEINENRSDENNHIDNVNQGNDESTEHVQSNYEDTQDFVESTPNEITNRVINDIAENVASRKELSKKTHTNKAFVNMIMNIKRELIDEQETENGGHGIVRIKTEPKENNENKENDVSVINNTDDVKTQCTIC